LRLFHESSLWITRQEGHFLMASEGQFVVSPDRRLIMRLRDTLNDSDK
jgi:hypothetical protein